MSTRAPMIIPVVSKHALVIRVDQGDELPVHAIIPEGMGGRILAGCHHPRGNRLDENGEVGVMVQWNRVAVYDPLSPEGCSVRSRFSVAVRPDLVRFCGTLFISNPDETSQEGGL